MRNLWESSQIITHGQTLSYFFSSLSWAALGSDTSSSAFYSGRAYGLNGTNFSNSDSVLDANNKTVLLFKFGEKDGVQDNNKDRMMISWNRYNYSDSVDNPVGIGCYTNRSGVINYRDIVPIANSYDYPLNIINGTPYSYLIFIR